MERKVRGREKACSPIYPDAMSWREEKKEAAMKFSMLQMQALDSLTEINRRFRQCLRNAKKE